MDERVKEPHIWTIAHDPGRLGSPDWWRRNVPREPSWWRRTFVEPFNAAMGCIGKPPNTSSPSVLGIAGCNTASIACPDCGRKEPLHWPWCVQTPREGT